MPDHYSPRTILLSNSHTRLFPISTYPFFYPSPNLTFALLFYHSPKSLPISSVLIPSLHLNHFPFLRYFPSPPFSKIASAPPSPAAPYFAFIPYNLYPILSFAPIYPFLIVQSCVSIPVSPSVFPYSIRFPPSLFHSLQLYQ